MATLYTNMESSLKTFHEILSVKLEAETASSTPLYQITRTAAQVTKSDATTVMLIPPNSPLVTRQWISEDFQCDDDTSLAVEQLKTAIKEVEKASGILCAWSEKKVAESKLEVDHCQQYLKHYQDRCANAEECERKLRQQYELEITRLEKEVAMLCLEKKEENTTHTSELENLKQRHEEEIKDLQYTTKLQAKHCRELDSELEELKSKYAKKEKKVANLREKLEIMEMELAELGHAVKDKEAAKKDFEEQKAFAIEEELKSMLLEKEQIEEKLKTCKGIRELVSKLPNLTSQAECDEVTKQVIMKLKDVSRTPSAKKAKSWH